MRLQNIEQLWSVSGGQLGGKMWRVTKCSVRLKRLECIHFKYKSGMIFIGKES